MVAIPRGFCFPHSSWVASAQGLKTKGVGSRGLSVKENGGRYVRCVATALPTRLVGLRGQDGGFPRKMLGVWTVSRRSVRIRDQNELQDPASLTCFGCFLQNSHKNVILSGAPHRFIACHSAYGAESKDPGGAYLTHAARAFSTTEVHPTE